MSSLVGSEENSDWVKNLNSTLMIRAHRLLRRCRISPKESTLRCKMDKALEAHITGSIIATD